MYIIGLVNKELNLNGDKQKVDPFPPGTFEEYDIRDDGFVKFVRIQKYFSPGDRPIFKPFVPYGGINKIFYIFKFQNVDW